MLLALGITSFRPDTPFKDRQGSMLERYIGNGASWKLHFIEAG